MMLKTLSAVIAGSALAIGSGAPALAFDCIVANKPPTAGSAVLIGEDGTVTPLKPNPGTEDQIHGGFIAFSETEEGASTFVHAPDGVLPPAREGGSQYNCDGKGLDAFSACGGE
jgi:hypothetical protein